MQWMDQGIIISSKKYGEHALIIQALTREHGLHSGLVRSARKSAVICQPGNQVSLIWKARLEEQLGNFTCELEQSMMAVWLEYPVKLAAINSACALVHKTLPEREPHVQLFDVFMRLLQSLEQESSHWKFAYVKFEMELLVQLGYGLDLHECAASGQQHDLVYVSPKSGQAVSKDQGEPYQDKLLPLPNFLRPPSDTSHMPVAGTMTEIIDGMRLTRYFLEKFIFSAPHYGKKIPEVCDVFLYKLQQYDG